MLIAHLVDDATVDDPGHLLVHVSDESDGDFRIGVKPLDRDTHPFTVLAGFTAPREWSMFGLRVLGTGHHLEGDKPSEPMCTTFMVHRAGKEASLLRRGDTVEELPGPAHGTLPDLCRRVLGLPTAPAPASTALVWTLAWLDQILEACGDPVRRSRLQSSWTELALAHPAVRTAADDDLLSLRDPARLVAIGRAQAEAWTWARLRAEPGALHLPDGDLPPAITAWMDDGFYARWAIGSFPTPATVAHELCDLLGEPLATALVEVLEGLMADGLG